MHEIAVTATVTAVLLKLATRGLTKVSNRREISNYRSARVEPSVKGGERGGSFVLLAELDVDVSDHVVSEIVADVKALDVAELGELLEDVLVEIFEVLLDLARVERLAVRVDAGGNHIGALVHIGQKERRGDRRAVMETGAAVAVAARPDLEVERAVNAVLLCAENGCKVLRHDVILLPLVLVLGEWDWGLEKMIEKIGGFVYYR
ncbi:hypothetical protein PIB30_013710 [Stylosanthes scabra]|uniref:Uncharacterized protein n=1 Tax=Stylosanthes scabra TaxID=79078 RepID=A0ABU6X691_9FABA|nr:hypothetical protein [Stylosanthes scabra]